MLKQKLAPRRWTQKRTESVIEICEQRLVLSASATGEAMSAAMASGNDGAEQGNGNGKGQGKKSADAMAAQQIAAAFGDGMAANYEEQMTGEDPANGNNGRGKGKGKGGGRAGFSTLADSTTTASPRLEINFLQVDVTASGIEIRGRVFHSSGNHGGHTITINGAISVTMTTNGDGEFVHVHSGTATGLLSFTGADHSLVWWV